MSTELRTAEAMAQNWGGKRLGNSNSCGQWGGEEGEEEEEEEEEGEDNKTH